jgi:hypothetical protein
MNRRKFFALFALPAVADAEAESLDSKIGLTTGSFMPHLDSGEIKIIDLPKIMQDDLDMRVLDLMTRTLESFEPAYVDRLRKAAEDHGCIITNLKMNQKVDMASPDEETRALAMKTYRKTIDVAHRLGCRWVRPVPGAGKADPERLAAAYRELIDYARPKGISLLIENTGWISSEPDGIPKMIGLVGDGLAASPDTGNWKDDEIRYPGLTKAYPFALTSDYKAYQLEKDGSHPRYDLERCFQVGWDAGFRGPWCIEHFNKTLPGLLAGFCEVRDRINRWIAENS